MSHIFCKWEFFVQNKADLLLHFFFQDKNNLLLLLAKDKLRARSIDPIPE